MTSLGVVLRSSPFSKIIVCRGNVKAGVCPGRHSPSPLSTACCGYGSGDTGLPVVPHHGVAVRTQGVLCVTGLGYATTGPRFGPGPVSWKPPSRGNPQTTACCGGGSCGKLRKKGPSCDFSTNVRVSFERMRERVSNECVRESFARMEIVGF